MSNSMFLVLLETSGNQNYIFSTNKLRDNIGASELTYRSGTQWVLDAVHSAGGPQLWAEDTQSLRDRILDEERNQPIDATHTVEVILATSGKALLLTTKEDIAHQIIEKVTCKALVEAPGLDICGVIHEFDWDQDCLGEMNRLIHQKFERVRASRPSPTTRFLRLPVVAECPTSGLPASGVYNTRDDKELRSQVTHAKRKFVDTAVRRLLPLIDRKVTEESYKLPIKIEIVDSIYALENTSQETQGSKINWLAVIHADGNGLGEIFLKFHEHIGANNPSANRDYVKKLRRFSLALDVCTQRAFIKGLSVFFEDIRDGKLKVLPMVPLVLGGDDLTVVCDGQYALRFTQAFLQSFEEETALDDHDHIDGIIPELAKKALGKPRLSACAGVAIIKPHFPFSVAYQLAEELMSAAKIVKKKLQNADKKPFPCSALDFHVLYDTSGVELDKIREKLDLDAGTTKLWGGPYIITQTDVLREASNFDWSELHRWEKLLSRVQALEEKDEETGKRKLPNSQMHDLRDGLFLGKEGADAKLQLIYERYKDLGLGKLLRNKEEDPVGNKVVDPVSLFWQESLEDAIINVTGFLDAIAAASFLKGKSDG